MRLWLFIVASALCVPAIATAQINLAWNDCITQPSATANQVYACDGSRNGQPFRLVASFIPPFDLTQFVGLQAVLDVHAESASLPDWWRLAGPPYSPGSPECRAGNITFPASTAGIGTGATGACRDPWLGAQNVGGGWAFYSENKGDDPSTPTPWPGWGRLRIAFARSDSVLLIANTQYFVGVIELDTWRDVDIGAGTCTGCAQSACIIANTIELYQIAGTPPQDLVYLSTTIQRQHVNWNGSPFAYNGCYVPTHRSTWGSIKATYR